MHITLLAGEGCRISCKDVQWLVKKLVVWSIYLIKWVFLAKGSKQCEIGGFQKGTACSCASGGCKVTGCQSFSTSKNQKCS